MGRDHAETCEHCGCDYSGFNGPDACPCRASPEGERLHCTAHPDRAAIAEAAYCRECYAEQKVALKGEPQLREALEFYADPASWKDRQGWEPDFAPGHDFHDPAVGAMYTLIGDNAVHDDHGDKARAALDRTEPSDLELGSEHQAPVMDAQVDTRVRRAVRAKPSPGARTCTKCGQPDRDLGLDAMRRAQPGSVGWERAAGSWAPEPCECAEPEWEVDSPEGKPSEKAESDDRFKVFAEIVYDGGCTTGARLAAGVCPEDYPCAACAAADALGKPRWSHG